MNDISIHAPARGASGFTFVTWGEMYISIHAPARGASLSGFFPFFPQLFQFTPLREGLLVTPVQSVDSQYFNSRPCEWGFWHRDFQQTTSLFQFTPLREGLRYYRWFTEYCMEFQFTPLREGLRSASLMIY